MSNSLPVRLISWRGLPVCIVCLGLMTGACASKPTLDPQSPAAASLKSAEDSAKKGHKKEAIALYQQSLTQEKKNPPALKGLAALQEVSGDLNGAKESYKSALALDDEDNESRRALGRILIAQGFAEEAKEQFKTAYAQNEKDTKALVGYGVALDHLGQHEKAQKKYLKALEHEAGDLGAINNLAYSYILSAQYGNAIALLETRLSNPGMTPAIRQNLAMAYGLVGDVVNAERVAKIDLLPNQVRDNLAFYKKRRQEISVQKPATVALGPVPTQPMAQRHAMQATTLLQKAKIPAKAEASSEVTTAGGTPRFVVRIIPAEPHAKPPLTEKILCPVLTPLNLPCTMLPSGL